MYKAIIFDLDGTLCYTLEDIETAMNETLGILGYPINSREHILSIINNGAKTLVRKAMPETAASDERLFDEAYRIYDALYALHCCDKTTLYSGIADTLAALKAAGMKIGVNTNKQDSQSKLILGRLLPAGTFDYVIGAGIHPPKPSPEGALDIASRLGVSPSETVYCGDSDVDMKTAHNSGMFPLGVTWGYRDRNVLETNGAGFIAGKPSDIADFLLK